MKGATESLAKAVMQVDTKVYTATHHHFGHVSSGTLKRRVLEFRPMARNADPLAIMICRNTATHRSVQTTSLAATTRWSLKSMRHIYTEVYMS